MTPRILHVVTNVAHYADPDQPTGLWLGELTHAWQVFAARGYEQCLVSPAGGASPLEPRALKWPILDSTAKSWLADPASMARLASTAHPDELAAADFAAIYFTGGHGVMWDFPDSAGLQRLTREIFEQGGVVSSVCHGYCGLLNTRLSDGRLLVEGRRLTGYAWIEEVLAGVAGKVPYNVEEQMRRRGAHYEKGWLPFTSKVVSDGRLVTGQNPQSARATAMQVVALLQAIAAGTGDLRKDA
ncbi:type 1 glutamine amidotransferase domain-containing protein [Pseudomonas sp. MPFS]|uniref:type 1 glutamine amidotransferase domain-containing protein n=1 Tax=Pseudomonas sp. MPFS TaxID=2795724 RepID=UPI001F1393F6|nr:type 1 glutamine amidotransferase domain-containing protein [Pseudomonas sp. MPFS]UMZ14989.1 type 1 glutamine amidotransferase domain-containing protein [Pseudomonas sp. MPFS]